MARKTNIANARAFEALARTELPRLLEQWSGHTVHDVSGGALSEFDGADRDVDMVLEWAGYRVLVEVKSGAKAAQVDGAIRQLREYTSVDDQAESPLIAVPHMGEVGAQKCAVAGINWVDLSGNAEIRLGGISIHRRGEPNRFIFSSSRPNPFSTKASRIPRALLTDSSHWWKQEDLISEAHLSRGYVSQVVSELERLDLIVRDEAYRLRPRDPSLLLDSWHEEYTPRTGLQLVGHVPARTGEKLAGVVSSHLVDAGLRYGLTALAAAWRYRPTALFRNVHVYVRRQPTDDLYDRLGFREGQKGANLHFIVTDDESVWRGAREVNGAMCVSPLQAYLDLKGLGERAPEAAHELRRGGLGGAPRD